VDAYWASWCAHMDAVADTNARALAYFRSVAAASSHYATALGAAVAVIAPVVSGEVMAAANATQDDLNSVVASGRKPRPAPGLSLFSFGAAKPPPVELPPLPVVPAAKGMLFTPPSPGTSAGSSGVASSGGSASHPGPGSARSGDGEASSNARHALSLSLLTHATVELQAQAAGHVHELAYALSREVCGDGDGPLGKKGDGKHSDVVDKKRVEATAAAPGDLLALTLWYANAVEELKKAGGVWAQHVIDISNAVLEAYVAVDEHLLPMLLHRDTATAVVPPKFRGRDLWLTEVRYRRACRAALSIRQRYMAHMANLFERYRAIEAGRTEALAAIAERHAALTSRLFDRVSGKAVSEEAKALNTHADFFRVVSDDTAARIAALAAKTAVEEGDKAAVAAAAVGAGGAGGSDAAGGGEVVLPLPRTRGYSGYGGFREDPHAGGAGGAGGAPKPVPGERHRHFTLELAPAVISPLCSPLVVRCGLLYRQVSVPHRCTVLVGPGVAGVWGGGRRKASCAIRDDA